MPTERRHAEPGDRLFVLGLIGRAGGGKSTVARALAADGAQVIDADRLGHEVTHEDREVRAAIRADYGPWVYRADGTLDRALVAARVFRDDVARARLDRLVHPRIIERALGRIEALRAEGFEGLVVLDAALLLDWQLERRCDAVIAVLAPDELAVERLVQERGWTAEQARQRLAVQRPDHEFRAAADVTLDNIGTPEMLERAARAAVRTLRTGHAPARKEPC